MVGVKLFMLGNFGISDCDILHEVGYVEKAAPFEVQRWLSSKVAYYVCHSTLSSLLQQ